MRWSVLRDILLSNFTKSNRSILQKDYLQIGFYKRDKSLKISRLFFRTPELPKLVPIFSSEGEFAILCLREERQTRSKTENVFFNQCNVT